MIKMKIYFKRPLRGLNESVVYINRKAPITAPKRVGTLLS